MRLYYLVEYSPDSQLQHSIIDLLELELENGETVVLDWDEADYGMREENEASGRMKGIQFGFHDKEFEYANGMIDKMLNVVAIHAFQLCENGEEIPVDKPHLFKEVKIRELEFVDDEKILTLFFDNDGVVTQAVRSNL